MPIIIDKKGRREVTQQEHEKYLASLPVHEPVENDKTPDLQIEYSHDIPSKSLVIVKVKGHEPKELYYPEGFVWDDEWILNNVNITAHEITSFHRRRSGHPFKSSPGEPVDRTGLSNI